MKLKSGDFSRKERFPSGRELKACRRMREVKDGAVIYKKGGEHFSERHII